MSTVATEIRAFTANKFVAPSKFVEFCRNGGKPLGGIIGGRNVKGSMNVTFETSDPGSLEVLATVCEMGQAEVADAVTAATKAFHGTAGKGWQNTSIEERCRLAMKLVELCERDRDVLLACEILDGGKVSELAEGDFTQIRECAEYFCRVAKGAEMGDSVAMQVAEGVKGFTYREPWGVVAGIIPWNYPIVLTAWFMFPALLAGNCILIKPAEDTPLSALYIGKLAEEAGFPAGVINVLPGRGEITGQCIAEHPGVRYISFTGSPGVGQSIMRTCDQHGTRMKREMGGNGSAIVLADADPELVARKIGRYTNQHFGQTCCTFTASSWTRRSPMILSMPKRTSSPNSRSATKLMRALNWARWSIQPNVLVSSEPSRKRSSEVAMPFSLAELRKSQVGPATISSRPCIALAPASIAIHRKCSMRSQPSAQSTQLNKPYNSPTVRRMDSAPVFGREILRRALRSQSNSAMGLAKSIATTR